MNVLEGLQTIRVRLEENGAHPETITLVEQISRRAALPAAQPASAQSLLQLVRMLSRTPVANTNTGVYNDLVRLEDELQVGAARAAAARVDEEDRPTPKLKKYYKDQKAKNKSAGSA